MLAPVCFATWTHAPPQRYTNNIYHQAEVVYPMMLAALGQQRKSGKLTIHWRFPILSWSRGMLEVLARACQPMKVSVVLSNRTTVPPACMLFGPSPSPGQFFRVKRDAAAKLRSTVLRACGLAERLVAVPQSIVHMPRRGDGLQRDADRPG